MTYYAGAANNMAELRQALTDACVLEGWAWDSGSEVLSKGAMFLRVQIVSDYLTLLGRTSPVAGDAPDVVRIGQIGSTPITWPAQYEFFVFAAEVYAVVNYGVDFYQWCAFGDSTVQGLSGSGMWLGASVGSTPATGGVAITATSGGVGTAATTAALFWGINVSNAANRNCWVHSDLDAQGWWLAQTLSGTQIGVGSSVPLIGLLPNTWNSEAVLLPIRAYKIRPSSKISLIADLEHARHTRIDNYAPGEIITIGSDRWKIFPWYRKDAGARAGGSALNHTGTFGWAIRYEGP